MEISFSTIALLFPAIPLMFLVYANTSTAVGVRMRELFERVSRGDVSDDERARIRDEAAYLSKRLVLLRSAQMLSGLTFLFNITTMFSVYADNQVLARTLFACAVVAMMVSIALYLSEISLTLKAVRVVWKKLR